MAQPFGVGDVVGGRYRITHHVVTSADQDIVFQGVDQVLSREVSILLAAKSNAKQVATSAKELAAGERESGVQVLDLGLAEDRTYLISSLIDPNALLDLVVPDAAPYVEPFFTDSLGSELFGQSRVMEPETYEDDAEYYARLHGLAEDQDDQDDPGARYRRRRPAFLDKVSDQLNRRLGTEREAEGAGAVPPAEAEQPGQPQSEQGGRDDAAPRPGSGARAGEGSAEAGAPAAGRPPSGTTEASGQEAGTQEAGTQEAGTPQTGPPRPNAGIRRRPSAPFPIDMPPSSGAASSAAADPGAPAQSSGPAAAGGGSVLAALPPSLADLQPVETSAQADTEEEFGVRAQQDGSFQPTGPISFGGAAASLNRSGTAPAADQDPAAQPAAGPHHGPAGSSGASGSAGDQLPADHLAEGEEVVDDPPAEPVSDYDRPAPPVSLPGPARSAPAEAAGLTGEGESAGLPSQQPDSFTGLIRAVNDDAPRAFPAAASGPSAATEQNSTEPRPVPDLQAKGPGIGRWLAAAVLAVLVLAAAVITFIFLGSAE